MKRLPHNSLFFSLAGKMNIAIYEGSTVQAYQEIV